MSDGKPMKVRRVTDEYGGSHIEPPLDPTWSDHDALRWNAGVMLADTGIEVLVHKMGRLYGLQVNGRDGTRSSLSATAYPTAWRCISDMTLGAQAARRD